MFREHLRSKQLDQELIPNKLKSCQRQVLCDVKYLKRIELNENDCLLACRKFQTH